VLRYLLRRSYAYIYSLLLASEPVSEALLPVYNQLQTLRRCLIEVKRSGGVSSVRELYPYSMKVRVFEDGDSLLFWLIFCRSALLKACKKMETLR
jgi:hypothetical protein